MPIKTEVTCWQLTGNNSNKRNKPKETPSTSFQVQWEKVVSSRFKEQAEKKAKEFVDLTFPPDTFNDEQLNDLKFGDMDFYDMLTNMVVRIWIYYFKNGIPIDYELLKRSAENPLAIQTLYLNIFGESAFFNRIKKIRNELDNPKDLPDLYIRYINSDTFTPTETTEFMAENNATVTNTLYAFYLQFSEYISNGFLDSNKSWFRPLGSLDLSETALVRVNGTITTLQENPKYKHLTREKALQHLAGKLTLEQALALDPVKGGNRTQRKLRSRKLRKNKRNCTHKRKRNRTHKRLSATAKSRIMRGK